MSDRSDHVSAISADGASSIGGAGPGRQRPARLHAGGRQQQFAGLAGGRAGRDGLRVDSDNHRVQAFTAKGAFVRQFGSIGSDPGEFATPFDLNIDGAGTVYVEDDENAAPHGILSIGSRPLGRRASDRRPLRGHGHSSPFDPKGRLVVSDDDNGIVAYLDPATGKVVDSFQGNGCDATVDAAGNVYVDDCGGGHVSVLRTGSCADRARVRASCSGPHASRPTGRPSPSRPDGRCWS